jgi:hypothetical protein
MAEHADHITCQEVVELVTDYLEYDLAPEAASRFEEHLNFCDGCIWYVDQMRETIAAVGRIQEEEVPPQMRARLLTAFRDFRRP